MGRFGEQELGAQELNRLIAATKQYWQTRSLKPILVLDSLEKYIQNLLPRELMAAHDIDENRLPKKSQKADVLVLLVGFSFEPLLQSICAYKPKEVLLVLNDVYTEDVDGQMVGGWIRKLIKKLPKDLLPEQPTIRAVEIDSSTGEERFVTTLAKPDKVFQFLINQLLRKRDGNEKGRIVIDITGAKKSMVTGAYLFGALTDCALSYVDFEIYEPEYSSPYGYSCNIGEISNPYRSFQIANWRRVQERYEHYALGEAANLLNEIISELDREGIFEREKKEDLDESHTEEREPEELTRLKKLREIIGFYASWEAGDIPRAYDAWKSKIEAMKFITLPMVIEKLGPTWQEAAANGTPRAQTGAFAQAHWAKDKWAEILGTTHWQAMLVYVQDELAKIQRILRLQGDARAAFIRAANLHEYTLKMRLLILANIPNGIFVKSGDDKNDFFKVAFKKVSDAILFSLKPDKSEFTATFIGGSVTFEPSSGLSQLNLRMFSGWDTILSTTKKGTKTEIRRLVDRFRDVRNSAVHNLSVIPQEDAESAVEFVEKDWDNLRDPWAKLLLPQYADQINLAEFKDAKALRENPLGDTKFGLPLWNVLLGKEMCNIDFLPVEEEKAKPIQEP